MQEDASSCQPAGRWGPGVTCGVVALADMTKGEMDLAVSSHRESGLFVCFLLLVFLVYHHNITWAIPLILPIFLGRRLSPSPSLIGYFLKILGPGLGS